MSYSKLINVAALLALAAAAMACSQDPFRELAPGDCVREKGLGLTFENGIHKIDCSEHEPFSVSSGTWIVKVSGESDRVAAECPDFGLTVVDDDFAVCFSSGQ